jgi:hypothetical protein
VTDPAPSGIRVTMRHVRAAKICGPGIRPWFANFDPELRQRFRREGIPVEEVEAMKDAFADRVAAQARKEAADNGR